MCAVHRWQSIDAVFPSLWWLHWSSVLYHMHIFLSRYWSVACYQFTIVMGPSTWTYWRNWDMQSIPQRFTHDNTTMDPISHKTFILLSSPCWWLLFTSGILYYGEWCRFVCVRYHIWKKLLLINTEGQIVITISYILCQTIYGFPWYLCLSTQRWIFNLFTTLIPRPLPDFISQRFFSTAAR